MSQPEIEYNQNEEITLKDLILKFQDYFNELLKNWWVIALISLPVIGFFIFKTFNTAKLYNAEIRFVVQDDNGSGIGGLGGILGNFGIRRSGGTNPYKIIEVGRSKRILEEVLFSKLDSDSLLIDKIINTYELDEKWIKKYPEMEGFNFLKPINLDSASLKERVAFISSYNFTMGGKESKNSLMGVKLLEEEGIFVISASTESDQVSLALVERTFEGLKSFFEVKILEDQKGTRELLKMKSDSIGGLINYKANQLARFEDRNRGLVLNQERAKKEILAMEIQGLRNAYGEVLRNYELADYDYRNNRPYFLVIDKPMIPLDTDAQSLIRNLIIGGFLGGILGVAFVIVRMIYRDAINV